MLFSQGGEEAENAASSPVEKSEVSSPVESEAAPAQATEAKEVEPAASPAEEKKEEATPAAEKEKPAEKIEATVAEKVEVSAGARPSTGPQFVEVTASHTKPIATPSIIERKTSEDLPSQFPSSPPPTPIDPSPLQQAQQAAASATALAEALKLPAEAASKKTPISLSSPQSFDEHTNHFSKESVAPLESQSEIKPLNETSTSLEKDIPESEVVQESPKEVQKQEVGNGDTEWVIQTEEGPIPICGDDVEPIEVLSEETSKPGKEVEVLLEAVEGRMKEDPFSSTTVFAAGESAQVSVLECKRPEPTTTLSDPVVVTSRKNTENEEEIPPPLPESPAPVIQEVSKILSFVIAEVPPTIVAPIALESVQESSSCPLPVIKSEQLIEETLSESLPESLPEISADLETSTSEFLEAPASAQIDDIISDDVSDSLDDLPPVPQELATCEEDSSDYPLPPEELSLQSLPVESQDSRILTESLLILPSSPSPASVSVTTTATTRECSETQLLDDQSNRDFKVESVSQSLNSFNDSESEMKERLTESESLTSQLTNGHIASDDHQVTNHATSWHESGSQVPWWCLNSTYLVV